MKQAFIEPQRVLQAASLLPYHLTSEDEIFEWLAAASVKLYAAMRLQAADNLND